MAKTIRDTILAYPGLADCEDFLDNVVLPGRGFEGTEDLSLIRYSHKAIVTIQSGQLVKGEWVAGEPTEIEVTGQYFPSNSGQQLKQNVDGKEFIVHGEFSTKIRPVENAKRIRIDSIALDVDIICWEPFQTHSVIYV